ncbi:MAG: hypothetical protein HY305_01175 [Sphingobacteriales bacterium]|nr:hypothetical protein [Sphingobacteriales bacterium]
MEAPLWEQCKRSEANKIPAKQILLVAKASAGARTQPSGYERSKDNKPIDGYGGNINPHYRKASEGSLVSIWCC